MSSLPAGYVDLGFVALHIAKLRQFTPDVQRFLRVFPLSVELTRHEPGSDEWRAFVNANCPTKSALDDLRITLDETAAMQFALAEELRAEVQSRQEEAVP